MLHYFYWKLLTLEFMCSAFIVLILENMKLFYTLRLVFNYIDLLNDSNLFKGLVLIKCLENPMETLQIFLSYIFNVTLKMRTLQTETGST